MLSNPFSSQVFTSIWLKCFASEAKIYQSNVVKNVSFIKHKYFPFYFNVGKNITSGMYYSIDKYEPDFKGKTFLIYDVPDYFDLISDIEDSRIKIKKAKQYNGYLLDLRPHNNLDDLISKFKSRKRHNLKNKKKQLEKHFNISYKCFYGSVNQEEFDQSIIQFNELIKKRFAELGIANNIVGKWEYYKELILEMVIDKKGLLFTVCNNDIPIAIAFCFLSDDILFYAAPTFDTDYSKYNLGHTTIMGILDWCFENEISFFDFSKGEFEYKKRWASSEYKFNTHVVYDSSSIRSTLMGHSLINYFKLKQYLRDKNINYLYSKTKHFFKKR